MSTRMSTRMSTHERPHERMARVPAGAADGWS